MSSRARPFRRLGIDMRAVIAQAEMEMAVGDFGRQHNGLVRRTLVGVPDDVGHRLVGGQHDASPFEVGETGGQRPFLDEVAGTACSCCAAEMISSFAAGLSRMSARQASSC